MFGSWHIDHELNLSSHTNGTCLCCRVSSDGSLWIASSILIIDNHIYMYETTKPQLRYYNLGKTFQTNLKVTKTFTGSYNCYARLKFSINEQIDSKCDKTFRCKHLQDRMTIWIVFVGEITPVTPMSGIELSVYSHLDQQLFFH